jgi:glycosyltransferase involved in cell wall biosynthesis
MRISVIIPTYNESSGIEETIARVYSQTRKPDEVLVVDDSTDDTPEKVLALAKKHRSLRLIRGRRVGVSAAKNLGAKNSKGDVLVFLDADILLGPDCLEVLEKKFRDKNVKLAYWANPPRQPKTFMEKCNYVRVMHLAGRAVAEIIETPHAYRRETFEKLKGFDPSLRYFEDRDIHNRIVKAGLRAVELGAVAEHVEPSSLGDFYKQASWLGKSIVPRTLKWRVMALLYPLGPLYWFAFLLAALLSLYYPHAIFAVWVLAFILAVEFLLCVTKTGMVLPSVAYVIMSFARQFIVAYFIAKRLLTSLTRRGK